MNRTFKNIAFFFFMGFGAFYLTADFLIHEAGNTSETLKLIYETFDMPFFFSGGMYALAAFHEQVSKRYLIPGLSPIFWILGILWTLFLLYLNVGYTSLL
jgi:hypothetical protein